MMLLQQQVQDREMSDSVFLKVERWLYHEDGDHWGAIEHVAPRRSLDSYRSVVDFLLCEACPEQKLACRRFYAGRGPQLRELSTAAERREMEAKILVLCEVAYQAHERKRRASWRSIRETAWQVAA